MRRPRSAGPGLPRLVRRCLGLLALPLALGACQSAVQQFQGSLTPLQKQIQTERSQIAATLQSVSLNDHAGARLLGREIAGVATTVAQIRKLKAPSAPAQHALAAYVSANHKLVRALYHVASVVGHGKVGQLRAASVTATDAAGGVQRASDALDATLAQ